MLFIYSFKEILCSYDWRTKGNKVDYFYLSISVLWHVYIYFHNYMCIGSCIWAGYLLRNLYIHVESWAWHWCFVPSVSALYTKVGRHLECILGSLANQHAVEILCVCLLCSGIIGVPPSTSCFSHNFKGSVLWYLHIHSKCFKYFPTYILLLLINSCINSHFINNFLFWFLSNHMILKYFYWGSNSTLQKLAFCIIAGQSKIIFYNPIFFPCDMLKKSLGSCIWIQWVQVMEISGILPITRHIQKAYSYTDKDVTSV